MATSSPSVQMEIRLATEKFLGELRNLESRYDATMKAVAGDTDAVGKSLEQSFKVLGIKSVQAVEQEIKQLQAALAQIRSAPDVLPADKAAAVAAFNHRLRAQCPACMALQCQWLRPLVECRGKHMVAALPPKHCMRLGLVSLVAVHQHLQRST